MFEARFELSIEDVINYQYKFLAVSGNKIEDMNGKVKIIKKTKDPLPHPQEDSAGTAQKPRLSVFRSNTDIYVQLIDDVNGETLAAASSKDKDIAAQKGN